MNYCRLAVRAAESKSDFEELDVDGNMVAKFSGMILTGLMWLRVGTIGRHLRIRR